MQRIILGFVALLSIAIFTAQYVAVPFTKTGVGSNTFTFVQAPTTTACTTPCATTIASTGTNHLLVVIFGQTSVGSADYITGVSGGCSGSWVIPASAKVTSASDGSVNLAYCLASSSGVTSITTTAAANGDVRIFEISGSTGTITFSTCNTTVNSSSITPQVGPTLTLSGGANYEVIQAFDSGGAHATSVAGPFGNFDGGGGISDLGSADKENTVSGSGASWTLNAAATGLTTGCAWY